MQYSFLSTAFLSPHITHNPKLLRRSLNARLCPLFFCTIFCRVSALSDLQYFAFCSKRFTAHSGQSVVPGTASSCPQFVHIPCSLSHSYLSRRYARSSKLIAHHPTASTAASMVGQYRSTSSAESPRRRSASQKISISSCIRVVSVIRLPPRTAPRFRRISTS